MMGQIAMTAIKESPLNNEKNCTTVYLESAVAKTKARNDVNMFLDLVSF